VESGEREIIEKKKKRKFGWLRNIDVAKKERNIDVAKKEFL
jgi:hypothetical protein